LVRNPQREPLWRSAREIRKGRILAGETLMTRLYVAVSVLVAAGSIPLGAQSVPPPMLIRSTYISVAGADTVWQNVVRTPESFQSDILLPAAGASVKVKALTDPRALIRSLDLDVWRGSGMSNPVPAQSASFAVTDDSVLGEVRAANRKQEQRFPSPSGAMIIQGNYLGFLEQLVLRARSLGTTETSIPLYFFGTPGNTGVAIVRLPLRTDSAIVSFGKRSIDMRVDEMGRIVSARNGSSLISRVKFREIFPPDSARLTRCGNAAPAARQALSQPALSPVFAYYKVTAADVKSARALNDKTDSSTCRDMLSLFQTKAEGPPVMQSLFKVGSVYVAVAGTDPAQAGAAIVYADDLEVAHMISLGAHRDGH
jgi:hypothetical protein